MSFGTTHRNTLTTEQRGLKSVVELLIPTTIFESTPINNFTLCNIFMYVYFPTGPFGKVTHCRSRQEWKGDRAGRSRGFDGEERTLRSRDMSQDKSHQTCKKTDTESNDFIEWREYSWEWVLGVTSEKLHPGKTYRRFRFDTKSKRTTLEGESQQRRSNWSKKRTWRVRTTARKGLPGLAPLVTCVRT